MRKYLKKWFKEYKESFKQVKTLRSGMVILYELVFYLLFAFSITLFSAAMSNILGPLGGMNPNQLYTKSEEQLSLMLGVMKAAYAKILLAILLFVLLVFLIWIISRALIWSALMKKKPAISYITKFAGLNVVWYLIWLVPFIIVFYPLLKISNTGDVYTAGIYAVFVMVFMLIPIYFTYILYYSFAKNNRIFSSVKMSFAEGVRKFPKLAFPLLTIILTLMVVGIVSNIFLFLPGRMAQFLLTVVMLLSLTWAKIYSVVVMDKVL